MGTAPYQGVPCVLLTLCGGPRRCVSMCEMALCSAYSVPKVPLVHSYYSVTDRMFRGYDAAVYAQWQ